MTTNIAEVLKLVAKLVQYDNDEKIWFEFRFKFENFTLVDERGTWKEETAVTIRTLSHTLHALLATLTTGRCLRLVQVETDDAGRRFAMLQAVLQLGISDNPGKFEETWKSWKWQQPRARAKERARIAIGKGKGKINSKGKAQQ